MRDDERVLRDFLTAEGRRQETTINLIPSENIASPFVRETAASVLMNKYSEGYPGRRYYPGNGVVDAVERMAQETALVAFGLAPDEWHVNVQPYSGSPANLAIYSALMPFGETLMGMQLSHGGHLTHGHPVSITGKVYRAVRYGVKEDGWIDEDALEALARHEKPRVIVSGATAYPRAINFKRFGAIARTVGAYHVADISHPAGLIAAGFHPSPFPHADVVMTTTHKTLRGPRGAVIFCRKKLADVIDKAVFPGLQGGPHNHVQAAKAACFIEALRPEFKDYQRRVVENAAALADALQKEGFMLVSGGTDTHLMLVVLRGVADASTAERILEQAGILANRNTVPGDESPFRPTGLRLGTPAVTTRGMGVGEMRRIAQWFRRLLQEGESPETIRSETATLVAEFPLVRMPGI